MSVEPVEPRRRHPHALYYLSLVEFFERLAFGAVLPLFVLYLHEHRGHPEGFAIALSSGFLSASYLASVPGGYLADRVLGPMHAARLGLGLAAVGLSGLVIDKPTALWLALIALLLGQGLFKPAVTTLVGNLYLKGDHQREAGFAIFYAAVNLGALVGPLMAECIRIRWGWTTIFAGAEVALLPALILIMIANPGRAPSSADETPTAAQALQQPELVRTQAVYLICSVSVAFWFAFQQTSTTLTFFAERHTAEGFTILHWSFHARPGHFVALHAALVIGLTPLVLRFLGYLRLKQVAPSTPMKLIWGFLFTAAAFAHVAWASLKGEDTQRISLLWLGATYLLLALGELMLSPMGLSLVTELAPRPLAGRFTGLWFASVAIGHGLAGPLGLLWGRWPPHRYFALIALLLLGTAGVLIVRLRTLEIALSDATHADAPSQPPAT